MINNKLKALGIERMDETLGNMDSKYYFTTFQRAFDYTEPNKDGKLIQFVRPIPNGQTNLMVTSEYKQFETNFPGSIKGFSIKYKELEEFLTSRFSSLKEIYRSLGVKDSYIESRFEAINSFMRNGKLLADHPTKSCLDDLANKVLILQQSIRDYQNRNLGAEKENNEIDKSLGIERMDEKLKSKDSGYLFTAFQRPFDYTETNKDGRLIQFVRPIPSGQTNLMVASEYKHFEENFPGSIKGFSITYGELEELLTTRFSSLLEIYEELGVPDSYIETKIEDINSFMRDGKLFADHPTEDSLRDLANKVLILQQSIRDYQNNNIKKSGSELDKVLGIERMDEELSNQDSGYLFATFERDFGYTEVNKNGELVEFIRPIRKGQTNLTTEFEYKQFNSDFPDSLKGFPLKYGELEEYLTTRFLSLQEIYEKLGVTDSYVDVQIEAINSFMRGNKLHADHPTKESLSDLAEKILCLQYAVRDLQSVNAFDSSSRH